MQMTAGTSALAADLETYIRQTQETRGQQITVLKQVGGHLRARACFVLLCSRVDSSALKQVGAQPGAGWLFCCTGSMQNSVRMRQFGAKLSCCQQALHGCLSLACPLRLGSSAVLLLAQLLQRYLLT